MPQWMLLRTTLIRSRKKMPRITRANWVTRSISASPRFRALDSWMPTILITMRNAMSTIVAPTCQTSLVEQLEQRHVFAEDAQVADGEIGRNRNCGHVIEELHPADDEPDGVVECPSREAGASAGMWDRRCAFRVVERGGDEDAASQDEG